MTEQPVYWCEAHNRVFKDEKPCCKDVTLIGTVWTREEGDE